MVLVLLVLVLLVALVHLQAARWGRALMDWLHLLQIPPAAVVVGVVMRARLVRRVAAEVLAGLR